MTDYRLQDKKTKTSERKEKFANQKKVHSVSETKQGLISRKQESDALVSKFRKVTNKYRADIVVKDPSTFAFYGSAKSYYEDALYNIVNYYPYDGTKQELLEWYENANILDTALLQNHWPSFVGHLKFDESEFVSFYAGPQSISESDYLGQFIQGQTGLRLDPAKGNTVEFWLKKSGFTGSEEVVFDVGSYPGKVSAGSAGQFKLYVSSSSGSPFYVDYTLGGVGVSDQNVGSTSVTTSSVGDDNWHHYAIKVYQESTTLYLELFVDGQYDSTTTASVASLSAVDTYMGGAIGATQGATSGTLSGSIDDFRFWKGKRNSEQIGRFFDQKMFASETLQETYETRLGLYYRFNKPAIGDTAKDQVVVDYSGNDITGVINNYGTGVRVQQSAITDSSVSTNTEIEDPSLDFANADVSAKKDELLNIGESYDVNNPSYIRNFVPDWVFDNSGQGLSNPDSEVSTLFQLMASEFDQIRINLDAIMNERVPRFEQVSQDVLRHEDMTSSETSASYSNNYFLGCDDTGKVYVPTLGAHSGFPIEKLEAVGIKVDIRPLINANIDQEIDRVIENVSITKPVEEVRRAILENIYSSAKHMLKRKGTERSFDSVLASYGVDRNTISYNIYGRNSEIFIDDTKTDYVSDEKNSVYLAKNNESTIFLSGASANERTYLEGDTSETEYTFEGTFIFPERAALDHEITTSSIFGLAEVSASNNDLTFTGPNNADFQVKVVKDGLGSDDAKFTLTSAGSIISNLETSLIQDVYKNSRWNIALRFTKDIDNKFISSSSPSYKVELIGKSYILDNLQHSFVLSSSLSASTYSDFQQANKTIYLGAQRTNITGSVVTKSDIKIIDFNAWNDDLSDEELQIRAKSPSTFGRNVSHLYRDNYSTSNDQMDENRILSIQFDAVSDLSSDNDLTVIDATSGSAEQVLKYGSLIGSKYPAKSTVFSSGLSTVVQREFLPAIRNIPLDNVHGEQGVEIKTSEINKFALSSRPEGKLFSFEKSMYQAISREMVNFLGGMKSFNNLIGEPVYKYRKNYKALDHLRQKFFETVENESQFERYVSYFRWIDKSIGKFLEQLIPATATFNAGIEDVVESHALERNKFDHKYFKMERKEPNLETNLLAINELLYDWEHGHYDPDDNDHCLWQKDREERTGNRETLRKVLTTVVSGSTYVLRNLVKPYKYTVDRQTLLNIGSNRKANKNRDLYKIVNEGKEITIGSDDIYEFKQCNDNINPQEEKIYTAKTNTTDTDGYLDADADLILPFTLYSASVGTDFENFKQKLKITNNHDGIAALQSPFVKEFVGGLPHRSVKFGTADADRPEAYDISASADTLTIKKTTAPKSMFHRDLGGSRFYHIGNVKTTETPLLIGNYSKEYEIVMTNGRSLNNNYLVENEGSNLTGSLVSSEFVSGAADFFVPQRPARDHVIVNKFSAPGGPETAGAYGLDRVAGEYSVYNTINYRNSIVRDVENKLSAEHSDQFGYRSGSASQASVHMTNRNPHRFTGSLGEEFNYNNQFIQHQIPQNDFGYAWVTSSANETVYDFLNKNENAGHQHLYNISGTVKSSETIDFVSSSQQTQDLDFVGLNTLTTRSVSATTNTLTNSHAELNTILLNRQGPAGHPSWKQTRGSEHPITRKHRRDNTLSVVYREADGKKFAFVDSYKDGYSFDFGDTIDKTTSRTTSRQVENYSEMFVTSRFNALNANLIAFEKGQVPAENFDIIARRSAESANSGLNQWSQQLMWFNDEHYISSLARSGDEFMSGLSSDTEDEFLFTGIDNQVLPSQDTFRAAFRTLSNAAAVSMKASVQNKITGFSQRSLESLIIDGDISNGDLWSKYINKDKFGSEINLAMLKNFLIEGTSPGIMRELNYIETIYPREINTYTKKARQREAFNFFGWDSTRSNRNLILSGNVSYGSALMTANLNLFFPTTANKQEEDFTTSFYDRVDIVDVNSTGSSASIASSTYITSSKWVLDSRQTFTARPLNITSSFFVDGDTFLASRSQGTRGEGILQNDYSIFGLGYNGLRGAPPMAPVYNRRIPQSSGSAVYLAGEAKWEAADNRTGPFYDTYEDYAEGLKNVGQTYSLIPEFRISKVLEDYSVSKNPADLAANDFLEVTGALYHTSSGNLSVGTQFFETYSMSDFMKYFEATQEEIEGDSIGLAPGRLTLRCQAVKRFLPYRGFYPAERIVQLSEIFDKHYLSDSSYSKEYIQNSSISESDAEEFLKLRIQNSKAQALKPIMAPGILLNSIKAGLAVDYPIFTSDVSTGVTYIFENQITSSLTDFSLLSMTSEVGFTGSLVNQSTDVGIPRLSGTVDQRIVFEDILNPDRLWDKVLYDNEPHPSASLMFGAAAHLRVLDRPARFGNVDVGSSRQYGAMNFETNRELFRRSITPFKSAVNNFCAETVNFFLEDGKLQTAMSNPDTPYFDAATYRMRVYIANEDTVMYDRHSAFGPPVDEGFPQATKYELTSSGAPGVAATARIDFNTASTSSLPNSIKPYYLAQRISDTSALADLKINVSASATYDLPGYGLTASNGTVKNVKYYDYKLFSGSVLTIKLNDPLNYYNQSGIEPYLTSSGHDHDHPYISITSSVSSSSPFMVALYDSSRRSGGVISNIFTDRFYLDIYDTAGSAYKTADSLAGDFLSALSSSSPNAFQSRVTGSFSVVRKDNHVAIFSKFIHAQSDTTVNTHPAYLGQFFTAHGDVDTKVIGWTSTGSTNTPGFRQFDLEAFTGVTTTPFKDLVVASTTNVGYVDLDLTSTQLRNRTTTVVNDMATYDSNFTITATNDSSDSGFDTTLFTQDTVGTAGNTTISYYGGDGDLGTNLRTFRQLNIVNQVSASSEGSPDTAFTGGEDSAEIEYVKETTITLTSSHGHLPFVPPFLDPNTAPYAELSFTPSSEGKYSVKQILENLSISYYNMPAPSNAVNNVNYQNAMVLSASINFKNFVQLQSDHEIETATGTAITDPTTSNLFRWVIQPKWETPVIDFKNVSASALNLATNTVTQVTGSPWKTRYQTDYYSILNSSSVPYLTASTGMWHQSGTIIDQASDKGYYMVIESGDIGNKDPYAAKDLAAKVGFLDGTVGRKSFKLGQIAETKEIYEAVVAIPFYNDPEDGIKFFALDDQAYIDAIHLNSENKRRFETRMRSDNLVGLDRELAKKRYKSYYNSPGTNGPENIAYQLRMMEKFVVPPQFDFLAQDLDCADIKPFVQYIFQFHTEFTRKDLASMWQNMYPNSTTSAATAQHSRAFSGFTQLLEPHDVEYISNYLDISKVGMFLSPTSNYKNVSEFLENEVRWLVFKAKQRAVSDYQDLVEKSISDDIPGNVITTSTNTDSNGKKIKKTTLGFNWPYDYFSLVELGKLESKVDFYDDTTAELRAATAGPTTTTSAFTSGEQQQGSDPIPYTVVGASSTGDSTGSSATSVASSMVIREVLLEDTTTPSTRIFTVTGGTISSGTEQLYVNGILQSLGAANDYTISGNTITLTYDLEEGDSMVVTYIKE